MGEFEKGHGGEEEVIADKERHEKTLNEILGRLHEAGFLRKGEMLDWTFPADPTRQKWLAQVETGVLQDDASVEERKKQFPNTPDPLFAALKDAGYRVVIDPDFQKSTDEIFVISYSLYEEVNK